MPTGRAGTGSGKGSTKRASLLGSRLGTVGAAALGMVWGNTRRVKVPAAARAEL